MINLSIVCSIYMKFYYKCMYIYISYGMVYGVYTIFHYFSHICTRIIENYIWKFVDISLM